MANPVAIIGTVAGAVLKKRAADKQEQAIRKSAEQDIALRRQMYEQDVARTEPFREIGLDAANQLRALYSPETGAFFKAPTMNELLMDPGFSFRLSEGEKALARMQAARGQYLSGGAIKAGQRYGQGLASQEFGAAFERERMRREAATNALYNLATFGPQAASQMGAGGRAFAQGAAGAYGTMGQAQADRAGAVGDLYGNVLASGISGYEEWKKQREGVLPTRQSSYTPSGAPSAVRWNSPRNAYYEGY
jgi:hypothetical protein